MKKALSKISKIFNKASLYTLYFLIFVLYLILFEIPIPFVASKVVKTIYEQNQENFAENQVDLSIKSISLGWNYNINRPVVIIKGISYTQGSYSINLSKVGFYPSIKNSIKDKELYLEKIFFEGLNLIVTSSEQDGYRIQIDNHLLLNEDNAENNAEGDNAQQAKPDAKSETLRVKQQESFLEQIQKKEDFKNSKFYQLVLDIKQEVSALKHLNEFIIYKSNIIFINQQKRLLILDVDNLSLNEQPKDIHINLKSSLTFDNDTSRVSKLAFNGSINSNNIVTWDLSLEKILLANFHNYVIKDNYLKDLYIDGFEGNINFKGFYNTVSGLEDFNSTVDVKQGSLAYKDYVSKPMNINNLSYNLFFDKKANTINVKGFNINFANNNVLDSDKLGLRILLNKLNADLKFDFKDNSLVVDKLRLFSGIHKVDLFIDYLPYSPAKRGYLNLEANSSNIDVGFVKQAWPKNYLVEVRKWIVENVSKGKVENTSFNMKLDFFKNSTKISKLDGDVVLSDARLSYLKGLPIVEAKKVVVNYDMNGASINYTDATTGGMLSKKGEVRFYNNSKNKNNYDTAMSLDLDVNASVLNALEFIKTKPLDLLKETGLDIAKLSGKVAGNVKLSYLFKSDEVVNKNISLQLSDVTFVDVLPHTTASNANLKFLLNDGGLKISGTSFVLDEKIDTNVQINWENTKNIIQTYSVDVKNFPIAKLYKLSFIDKKPLEMVEGSMDGEFNYHKDSKVERLSFYTDLTNALFYIDTFNYKNKVGQKLSMEGSAIFKDGEVQEIRNLKLNASDLSASVNIKVNKEEEDKTVVFNNFYIKDKANFKGSVEYSKNMKAFNLQGSFIDLAPIFSYFNGTNSMHAEEQQAVVVNNKETQKKKRGIVLRRDAKQDDVKASASKDGETKEGDKDSEAKEEISIADIPEDDKFDSIDIDDTSLSEKIGNVSLKLNFDKVVNGDEAINNVAFNLLWKDNFLGLLSFYANMDSSKENSYAIFDERTSILGFRIQNTGNLLRLLDFSSQIKGGDLEGKVNIKKIVSAKDKAKFYIQTDGKFVLNNFSAGLSFATAFGSFRGKDLYFRVDQLELQGNLMGGSMKGYIDVKNREVDIYGKLIPIWSANNLLTNAPILKTLFNNVPIAKNLIQINSRIKGSFDDIKYSVFSRDLQKGDIINELNYSKLGEDVNSQEDAKAQDDAKKDGNAQVGEPNEGQVGGKPVDGKQIDAEKDEQQVSETPDEFQGDIQSSGQSGGQSSNVATKEKATNNALLGKNPQESSSEKNISIVKPNIKTAPKNNTKANVEGNVENNPEGEEISQPTE